MSDIRRHDLTPGIWARLWPLILQPKGKRGRRAQRAESGAYENHVITPEDASAIALSEPALERYPITLDQKDASVSSFPIHLTR